MEAGGVVVLTGLGASYVEFDVQLTKDHVPVIYHDFLVGETGIDAPVHTLTLEQVGWAVLFDRKMLIYASSSP